MKKYEIQKIFPELRFEYIKDTIKDLERFRFEKPIYIIAMTPRTGSTALSSLLKNTNAIGTPDEYFNPRGVIQSLLKNKSDVKTFKDYLRCLNEDKNEKWFGLKITWQDFEIFYETGLFKTLFKDAKYIYLDRFDIEAQAVSLQHAIVTHKWHFTDESEDNFNFNEEDIKNQFNLIKLCNLIDKLKKEKENWQTFLYNIQEPPLYLYHELFLKDNKTALKKIFNFLNVKVEIDVDSAIVNSDYKKVKKPGYDNWLYKLKMFRTGNLFLNQKTDQK